MSVAHAIEVEWERQARQGEYRAAYVDVDAGVFEGAIGEELAVRFNHTLHDVIPPDLDTGNYLVDGSLVYRFVHLPTDPDQRAERVQSIAEAGSDRTSPLHFTNLSGEMFEETGRLYALVGPNNYFYAMRAREPRGLFASSIAGNCAHLEANGLLVYDAATPRGLVSCSKPGVYPEVFTFRQPKERHLALVVVIGFTNLDPELSQPKIELSIDHPLMQSMLKSR